MLLKRQPQCTAATANRCCLIQAKANIRHKSAFCKVCNTGEHVRDMQSPFAFRLLIQELQAMSIGMRFEF